MLFLWATNKGNNFDDSNVNYNVNEINKCIFCENEIFTLYKNKQRINKIRCTFLVVYISITIV